MTIEELIYKLERIKYNYGGDNDVELRVINNVGNHNGNITDIFILETSDAQYKLIIESEQND